MTHLWPLAFYPPSSEGVLEVDVEVEKASSPSGEGVLEVALEVEKATSPTLGAQVDPQVEEARAQVDPQVEVPQL